MKKPTKTIEIKVERAIPAPLGEVFDGWLNPKIPGNPWNAAEKFILDPRVDGLFYWTLKETSHYGRFTEIERPGRMQHTWVSPNTLGRRIESNHYLEEAGRRHPDDPCSFGPAGY